MAYNKTFNPDALPAFAEPERKTAASASTSSYPPPHLDNSNNQQWPSRHSSNQPAQQSYNQPAYGNKPPPPLPNQGNMRHDAYSGQGGAYQPPQQQQQQQYQQGSSVQPPLRNYGFASPPPIHHGGRPPPPQQQQQQQQGRQQGFAISRPPPTPAPQASASDAALLPLFRAVDKDGSGHLTEVELRAALVNGDWTSFDAHTVRMMIRMFDSDRSGTIGFEEFCGLWGFLAAWRTLFDRFDVDRSGGISIDEYEDALVAFGYRLSRSFVGVMFRTYDKRSEGAMSFDLFVQSCISLKRMTDVFKKYDDDRDGYITLSFEDFLSEILRQR